MSALSFDGYVHTAVSYVYSLISWILIIIFFFLLFVLFLVTFVFLVQVSVVTFGPKKVKDRNVGKMTVRGKGWDATVGGWWFDLKLTDVFAEGFNAKVCFQYCCRIRVP